MAETEKPRRQRSPNHPAFNIETAIGRAEEFYRAQKLNSVPADSAKKTWGYEPKSSSGMRCLASMLSYGLLEESGEGTSRKVKLTELGQKIVLLRPENLPERLEAIKTAAKSPKIHQQLLEEYPHSIPDDNALHNFLVGLGFNPDSISFLIKEWRDTFSFAGLGKPANILLRGMGQPDGKAHQEQPQENPQDPPILPPAPNLPRPGGRQMSSGVQTDSRTLTVPISGGRMVFVEAPVVFSSADYKLFKAILEAMKEGIINEDLPEAKESELSGQEN